VKPTPTNVVVNLPRVSGAGFIDIRNVNYRLLVKPAPTNVVVNLPREFPGRVYRYPECELQIVGEIRPYKFCGEFTERVSGAGL